MANFDIFASKDVFRYQVIASNGGVIHADTKGYKTEAEVQAHLSDMKTRFARADSPTSFYFDAQQRHRWRLESGSPHIISHEGFASKENAENNYQIVRTAFAEYGEDASGDGDGDGDGDGEETSGDGDGDGDGDGEETSGDGDGDGDGDGEETSGGDDS